VLWQRGLFSSGSDSGCSHPICTAEDDVHDYSLSESRSLGVAGTAHRPCAEGRCTPHLSTTISRGLSHLFEHRAGALWRHGSLAGITPSAVRSRVCSSPRIQIHVGAQSRHHASRLGSTNRTHGTRRRRFVLSLPVRSLGKYQHRGRTPLRLESQMVTLTKKGMSPRRHRDTRVWQLNFECSFSLSCQTFVSLCLCGDIRLNPAGFS
jgi:hypothetical protein